MDAREGVVDQGARGHAEDEDGDTIVAVVEEDDAEEPMMSNRGRRDVTPGLPDLGQLGTNACNSGANTVRAR
uniref:Uncharacterized protein n=1 Tax=Oryza punctata TaxID=4537 RepID=A0A0E0KVN1_ORYPU